jgi:hypothetical protein
MKRALRFAFLAIPLLGVLELALHLWFAQRPPAFDAWFELSGVVKEMRRQGELVVVAPRWAEPLARRALGDEAFPLRDLARPDETRYAAAIEIAILGQRAPELAAFREVERRDVGRFVVRRLENPSAARVVFDFTDQARPPAADARVNGVDCRWNPRAQIVAGGLGGHPTFPSERFECPGGVFFNVGPTVIADQRWLPRRCLWAHPPARGELVTRFRDVQLGSVIRGHGGMYWIIERERKGAPVVLTVRVDGETLGAVTHEDGEGWKAFEIPLGAHANAASAEVEFAVSSPNYRNRHFCFEADTR